MAARRPIYDTRDFAQRFRETIRPAMVGRIKYIEPRMANRQAAALYEWLYSVVDQATRASGLSSRKGKLRSQLFGGIRVTGANSLRTLKGRIWAYPWIFPHEFGATIEPTGGRKYLTIPIDHALRADGSPKYQRASAWKRWNSFVYKPKGDSGPKFIAYKAANRELRLLYLLVEEVEIPKRLRLNDMANADLGALLADFGQIFVQETVGINPFIEWLK
jgi:hypothetical protein